MSVLGSDGAWYGAPGGGGRAVGQRQGLLRVAPQRKLEFLVGLEDGVVRGGVKGDTDDLNSQGVELCLAVTEPATFSRSAACAGHGIEP